MRRSTAKLKCSQASFQVCQALRELLRSDCERCALHRWWFAVSGRDTGLYTFGRWTCRRLLTSVVRSSSIHGRTQPDAVAASADGCFWLMTGVTLKAGADGKASRPSLLRDLYRFSRLRTDQSAGSGANVRLAMRCSASPTLRLLDAHHFVIIGGGDDEENALTDPARHPVTTAAYLPTIHNRISGNPSGRWTHKDAAG